MKFFQFLTLALGMFVTLILAANSENYEVAVAAAEKAGQELKPGQRYAFYEYWVASRTSGFPQCFTGWSHIRLVIGVSPRTRSDDKDFLAEAWDLRVDAPDNAITYIGQQTVDDHEQWVANTSPSGKKKNNALVWAGPVAKSDKCVKSMSAQFVQDNPKYGYLNGANCKGYAGWLYQQIK